MPRLSDIAARIRGDIATGVLPLGQRVTVTDLAERYRVGQMPMREAVRRLLGEELFERVPGAGTRVRDVTSRQVAGFIDIATAIQATLARNAALHCAEADLDDLRQIERRRIAAVACADYRAALALNHDFHSRINRISGSDFALSLLERHRILISALWHRHGFGPQRYAGVENDHLNILRSLSRKDPDAAGTLIAAHSLKAKFELMERCEAGIPAGPVGPV